MRSGEVKRLSRARILGRKMRAKEHARSRKVGDRYNNSKEKLGHNDKEHQPSTYSRVYRHIQYIILFVNT